MAFYREGLGESPLTAALMRARRAVRPAPRLFSTLPRKAGKRVLKPNVRLLAIDPYTGKVNYAPAKGTVLTSSALINRRTMHLPTLAGYAIPPVAAPPRIGGLTSAQLLNRRTSRGYTLSGTPAGLTRVGGAEHAATWGLSGINVTYETIRVPITKLVGVRSSGLGRSFFGDIGAALSKAAGQVATVGQKVLEVALPVVGTILLPGIGTQAGGILANLLSKVGPQGQAAKAALQQGGPAVASTSAQARANAQLALNASTDPSLSPTDRQLAVQSYQYFTAVANTLDGAVGQANAINQGLPVTATPTISAGFSSVPGWVLPAAAAAGLVLLARR